MRSIIAMGAILAMAMVAAPVSAAVLGEDAAACAGGKGPAIAVNVVGLKDRVGAIKLELYPANEGDFLRDDYLLEQEHKTFRRVTARPPQSGSVMMCMKVPAPGRYALLFTHNRNGQSKFNFWSDGAGFPSNQKLGRARPKLGQALITAGPGVTSTTIQAQYLRGISGFGPIAQ